MMEWCAAWLHPMTIQSELSALQTVRIVIILLTVTAVSLFFYRKYRYERKRGEEMLVEDDSVDGYVPVSKFDDAIALFCVGGSEGGRNKPGVPFEILVRLGDEKEEEEEEQRGETSTDYLKEVTLEPTVTKNVVELLKELKELQSRSRPTGTSQRRVRFSENIEVREFESLFMHLSRKKVKGGLSERRKESYKYFFSPSEREETEDYLFEGDCESRCLLEHMLCPFEESLNRNVNSEIRNCIDEEGKEGKVVLLHYKDRADQIASNSVTFGMVLERKALERGRKARLEAALIYQEVDNDHVVVDDDDFEDSFADSSDFLEDDAAVEEEILPPKESPRQSRSSPSPRRRSQRLALKGLGSGFTPSGRRFSRRLASLA